MLKGLGNLANIGNLLQQAQEMGTRLQSATEELKTKRVSGSSGGGMVVVEASGIGEILACRLDPSVAGDRELIEDLLPGAINQALAKSRELHAEAMRGVTGGLDLPGVNEAIARFTGGQDTPQDPK